MSTSEVDNLQRLKMSFINGLRLFERISTVLQLGMMKAMGLKSPAPIQSRLKHLQEKVIFLGKKESKNTSDSRWNYWWSPYFRFCSSRRLGWNLLGYTGEFRYNWCTQKEECFRINSKWRFYDWCMYSWRRYGSYGTYPRSYSLKNGTIVSALVPGLGTTLKYFFKRGNKIFLEAANTNYEPIELNKEDVVFQGKLLAVWRKL